MGSLLGKQMQGIMDENLKKQQQFMLNTQKMQLERQMQMQLQLRQRMVATQLAMTRERMYWWAGFATLAAIGLTAGYIKTKQPAVLSPLLPIGFLVGYQADMAWGNKMERIIAETDSILAKEPQLLVLPGTPLSIKLLDSERAKAKK